MESVGKGWRTPTPFTPRACWFVQSQVFGVDWGGHLPCLDHLLSVPARGQSPHLACAPWRRRHQLRTRPLYEIGLHMTQVRYGRAQPLEMAQTRFTSGSLADYSNSSQRDLVGCGLRPQATFSRAPSETTPASTNRQRSTSKRRASATMPMRRWRCVVPASVRDLLTTS